MCEIVAETKRFICENNECLKNGIYTPATWRLQLCKEMNSHCIPLTVWAGTAIKYSCDTHKSDLIAQFYSSKILVEEITDGMIVYLKQTKTRAKVVFVDTTPNIVKLLINGYESENMTVEYLKAIISSPKRSS